MNETELKPCPICGNTPDGPIDATRVLGVWRIVHRGCLDPNFAVEKSTKDNAIAAWNARADLSDALLKAERERALREAAEWAESEGLFRTRDEILALITKDAADD